MRVDLAEQTLSKDVENALKSIDELKDISVGTRVNNNNDKKLLIFKNKILTKFFYLGIYTLLISLPANIS